MAVCSLYGRLLQLDKSVKGIVLVSCIRRARKAKNIGFFGHSESSNMIHFC